MTDTNLRNASHINLIGKSDIDAGSAWATKIKQGWVSMVQEPETFDPSLKALCGRYEYAHCYALFQQYVGGRHVLDLSSGAGAGALMLAGQAASVTCLGTDRAATADARKRYPANNLSFVTGDCHDMPFDDDRFDVVVCDKTLGYLQQNRDLIGEVKRVLKADGMLVFSTSSMGKSDAGELSHMLGDHFDNVRATGVRMATVSVGFRVDRSDAQANLPSALTYTGSLKGDGALEVTADEIRLDRPDHVIVFCSDSELPLETGAASLFVSRDDDLWIKQAQLLKSLSGVHEELHAAQADLEKSRQDGRMLDRQNPQAAQRGASLATISRLLSRMAGESVSDDSDTIVEHLFALNETMVVQRGRLEAANALDSQLAMITGEMTDLKAQLADASAKVESAESLLDSERSASATIEETVAALQEQLADTVALVNVERSRADALQDRLNDGAALLDREREDAARLRTQLDEQRAARTPAAPDDQLRSDFQALKRKYEALLSHGGANAVAAPRATAPSASAANTRQAAGTRRELERFVKLHGNVQRQIGSASQGVQAHLAPRQTRTVQRSLLKRWARKFDRDAAPFRTIVFNSQWLASQSPAASDIGLGRYLRDSSLWMLDPHPLFSSTNYVAKNPDVGSEGICPLLHYLDYGWREGRNPHPYFLNDWYLGQDTDLAATLTVSPLEHYLDRGWREGRAPNPLFNPQAYLERYPDVGEAGIEPLTHYLMYGLNEKREIPVPAINPAWESLLPGDDRKLGLLDFILERPPLALPEDSVVVGPTVVMPSWPPERLNDFWLPQKLRDFIIEGGNGSEIDLYTYLCSVMEAFRDTPETFAQSDPCRIISERIRALSSARFAQMPNRPDASIIIPVYNNVIDTLLCISSVLEDGTSRSYEIIVADDGSNDATPQIIANLGGVVRYLRQPRNYGFLGNCNEAAKQASGHHIVLLNNDTLVMPIWLDALLDTFDQHENVGLSGSKLISWDGTLQEAGGIYWNDGSAWNFGRGADAHAAEFNYLKDVDYISGAAIALPTAIWRAMCGFDEIYAPAYCEDADIAFRLREAGYRTLLNPASEVLHHEGRSHGRDVNSGIKAYQVKNQETFLERWRSVLERDHYPNAQNVMRARDRSYFKKHVLVIDHYIPQWDQDAGSRSTFMCIKALLNLGYAVTFWPDNLWRDPQYTPRLQQMGVEVIYGGQHQGGFADFMRSRLGLYDAVFANRPHIAVNYLDIVRKNSAATIIYYGHDLHFKRMMNAQSVGEPVDDLSIATMRDRELTVCAQADVVLYPDQLEVDIVKDELGGDRVYTALPVYAFDTDKFEEGARALPMIVRNNRLRLLFVGGFNHTPNQDGILWFVRDVFPIIQKTFGGVHLTIVGSKATEAVLALAGGGIEIAGFVSDDRLAELYAEASLVIAPLRYGGGVKGKVIEAMATGVPLVTTPTGAQGLKDPESLMLVASAADEFAQAVVQALTDRVEATHRARRALEYVRSHYSMDTLRTMFHELIG
ncbi:glycosyltransferase [Sphingomonas ginsenosidivorax]|nr:glycosyltransferase [Sphingomonas ginsenosidivorax]